MRPNNLSVVLGLAAWAGFTGLLRAQTEPICKPEADAHTLFLAHFNAGFKADYAKGTAEPLKRPNRGGAALAPGRFGQALSISQGAFGLAYSEEGNIDPQQGTVEFWLRGEFADPTGDDQREFFLCFFSAGCDQTGLGIWRNQYNHVGCAVSEGYRGLTSLVFGNAGADRINDGKWHHIAVTWDREHVALFLDGRRKASNEKPAYPSVANWCNGAIFIGYAPFDDAEYNSSTNQNAYLPRSSQATLDELRISDVVRYIADFIPPGKEF
jgi:hypothetical protein